MTKLGILKINAYLWYIPCNKENSVYNHNDKNNNSYENISVVVLILKEIIGCQSNLSFGVGISVRENGWLRLNGICRKRQYTVKKLR